jgi:hypothetical protein
MIVNFKINDLRCNQPSILPIWLERTPKNWQFDQHLPASRRSGRRAQFQPVAAPLKGAKQSGFRD